MNLNDKCCGSCEFMEVTATWFGRCIKHPERGEFNKIEAEPCGYYQSMWRENLFGEMRFTELKAQGLIHDHSTEMLPPKQDYRFK